MKTLNNKMHVSMVKSLRKSKINLKLRLIQRCNFIVKFLK